MIDTKDCPRGGELNAAISNAVVRIHSQYVGRGPTKARTVHRDDVIVTILDEALTKAERTLAANGKLEPVMAMRHGFQMTMRDALVAEVERVTGRNVRAFMSDNHIDPDIGAEVFVLDGPVTEEATTAR